MTAHPLYEEAQRFIKKNAVNYESLLSTVKTACKNVEARERQSVKSVYSRGEKQRDKSELKETWKLPKKLLKIRNEDEIKSGKPSKKDWNDLPDVIGLTIVVYYPDQITHILKRVADDLKSQRIILEGEPEPKATFGYHARHAIVVSKRDPHEELRCEIQCKTMLHDSWATKMHDLTYKPAGYLEPRLELLMQAFGDTLESVERQSQAIRDMIMENWNAEAERRRLTHAELFLALESVWKQPDISDEAKEIRETIEKQQTEIAQAESPEDNAVFAIRQRVDALCQTNLEEGWVLAALMASFRPRSDLVAYLDRHADRWLREAAGRLTSGDPDQHKNTKASLLAIPLAYISAGNLDLAIDCYAKLLGAPQVYALNERHILQCKFNYANALVERHYFDPSEYRDGASDELKRQVDALLEQTGSFADGLTGGVKVEFAASSDDTAGFTQIAFGVEPKDVSAGIDLCNRARLVAQEHGFKVGEQYCDLHLRLGWRKLMELEARRSPTS
jgi:ppGpp synthetase/RelA/SpoT-type nucleotidyltranferase